MQMRESDHTTGIILDALYNKRNYFAKLYFIIHNNLPLTYGITLHSNMKTGNNRTSFFSSSFLSSVREFPINRS